uniref:Zinc finger CCCH-type containing 12B n=1 Tax=Pavo cristatus TaxID=9049 RepID=A0A8C9EXL2_PAVCR
MTAWSMVGKLKMEKRHSREDRNVEQDAGECSAESEEWTSSESEPEQPYFRSSCSSIPWREKEVSTKPHRPLCRSPCLDRPSFSQSSITQDLKLEECKTNLDKEYQAKMDFALKLGYAGDQIQAVLNKLGADALINDVLAELVRLGNKSESEGQNSASSTTSTLVPRGPCPKEIASPELSLEDEVVDNSDNLRPIVIDGSNVAMSIEYVVSIELVNGRKKSDVSCSLCSDIPGYRYEERGKKCTYGHKCKYYHPERANQPQRSVADELRISAKLSAVKTMSEGALAKCGTGPSSSKGEISSEVKRIAPKRQSDPSIRSVAVEPEEKLTVARKSEANSVPSLVSALSVPTLPPPKSHAAGALNTRSASSPVPGSSQFTHQKSSLEHMSSVQYPPILVTNSHGTSVSYTDQYPKYESLGDHGYYSLLSDFSNLSISSMHNTDYYGADMDQGMYSRNSSPCPDNCLSHTSNDSYSSYNDLYLGVADASPEDNVKIHRLTSQNRLQPFPHGYHEALNRVQSFGTEELKQSLRKQSVSHLGLHAQHPVVGARSSCPGEYPVPQNIHPSTAQPSRALVMTRMDSISDSRLYESNPTRQRRPPLCREQHASWDPLPCASDSYTHHSYPLSNNLMQPCYEPVMVRSMPEKMEQLWRNPWIGICGEPREPHIIPEHQYQTYKNLCNIFPPSIVLSVMEKNPHMTDAQQLAAMIVAKLRTGR